jgi:hypothetical protein
LLCSAFLEAALVFVALKAVERPNTGISATRRMRESDFMEFIDHFKIIYRREADQRSRGIY